MAKWKFNPKYRWLVICLCMLAALIVLFVLFGVRLFSQTELEPERRLEAPDYPVVVGASPWSRSRKTSLLWMILWSSLYSG